MLKVAMVSPLHFVTDSRSIGSVELLTSKLVDALITRDDVKVTLFASGDSHTCAELVPTIKKAFGSYHDPRIANANDITTKEVLKRAQNFDLIHSHTSFRATVNMVKDHGVPVVRTLHGQTIVSNDPAKTQTRLMAAASIPYLTPVSDSIRTPHPLLNYTRTVYNGVDIETFPFVSTPQGDKKGEYWFFMGRIHPEKGVYYAIRTALRHNKRLIIAGQKMNSNLGQRYFNEMVEPYLGEQIEYIGTLGPERARYLGNASLVLLPSCCDEGFGLVTVEALLCGTPVLGTRRGAFPEIVLHGRTGYLAQGERDSADEEELFSYALKAEALDRHACRKSVEKKFTIEKMAQGYVDVYNSIVEETKARTS